MYLFLRSFVLVLYFYLLFSIVALGDEQQTKDNAYNELLKQARKFDELRQPDSSIIALQKAILLTHQNDSIATIWLMMGDQYRIKNDFVKAFEIISKVDKLINGGDNQSNGLLIEKDFLAGKIYSDKGNYSQAMDNFDKSIELAIKIESNQSTKLIRIYNYRGITRYYLGDNSGAKSDYLKAELLCQINKKEDVDFADILQNMAIIHSVKGEFDSAFYYINRSRLVREAYLEPNDQRMASFYLNYGRFLFLVGETNESLKYYQKTESMLLSQVDRDEVLFGMLSINIGNAFQLRGDYEKALLYYQNALNSFSKKLPEGHANLNTAANNLAFAYNQIGEFDKSISISLKNIDLQLTSVSRVRLYRNIARSYIGLKNNQQAEVYFKMAIKSSEDLFGIKHFEYGVSIKDYAVYLSNTLRFVEAVNNFENALVVYKSVFGQNDTEVADVIRNIAYCKTRLKQFEEAEKLFFSSESILRRFESSQKNTEIQDLTSIRLTDLYFDFGNLYYLWYLDTKTTNYLQKSFQQLEKAVNLLDGLGVSLSDESRMQLSENVRARFAMAIEVAYQLYKLTEDQKYATAAFAYSGKSKAAVLLSSVKKLQAFTSAGVSEEILNLERKLREDIQAIRKLNYEERQKTVPNQGRITFLETRQYTMVRKYDSLLKQIEIGFPEYYSLRYNTGVIKMDELQHKLKNDEVLLEYVMGDSLFYTFAISKNEFVFSRLMSAPDISAAITSLRDGITADFWGHGKNDLAKFIATSGFLFANLIEPAYKIIHDKRLIIIPDGILGYLPFELLVDSKTIVSTAVDTLAYANLPYLLLEHPLSYAYSSTLLFSNYSQNRKTRSNMLAIVPKYGKKTDLTTYKTANRNLPNLPPLPYALFEAETVASIWGGTILDNEMATKENFLLQAKKYQILHLAMHAIIDDENPLYSRLVFQENNENLDKYSIGTYELYSQKLDASLVVLSACNTGKGLLRYGEGIMSLTRGFIYAGVPSIVMTSWEVHDKSGSYLMEQFYNYLKDGETKDVALQKAKIDFLHQANNFKSHPFFWAAYMVIGDVTPVKVGFAFYKSTFLTVLLVLATGIFYYLNKRRKWLTIKKHPLTRK